VPSFPRWRALRAAPPAPSRICSAGPEDSASRSREAKLAGQRIRKLDAGLSARDDGIDTVFTQRTRGGHEVTVMVEINRGTTRIGQHVGRLDVDAPHSVPSQCGGQEPPGTPASTAAQHRVGRSRKSSALSTSVAMVMRYVLVLVLVLVLILTGTGTRRTSAVAHRSPACGRPGDAEGEGDDWRACCTFPNSRPGSGYVLSTEGEKSLLQERFDQKEAASHIELTWDGIGREPVPAVIGDVPNFFSHLCGEPNGLAVEIHGHRVSCQSYVPLLTGPAPDQCPGGYLMEILQIGQVMAQGGKTN